MTTRFNPVIDDKKVCSKCGEDKELKKEYYFHSATGYYMKKCKICMNEERRINYPLASGIRVESKHIRQKYCKVCNIEKNITEENFSKVGRKGKCFSKVCKECSGKRKTINIARRISKGYLPDSDIKRCLICGEEKTIINFSYSKGNGYYSSYCRTCDSSRKKSNFFSLSEEGKEIIRKKGRDWHKNNKPKSLLISYNKFDFSKNLDNDLTKEFLEQELTKQCSYCSYPSTGLDRIDNSKGHLQNNCVPCCWECNTARMNNFTHEEMKVIGLSIKQVKDGRSLS